MQYVAAVEIVVMDNLSENKDDAMKEDGDEAVLHLMHTII